MGVRHDDKTLEQNALLMYPEAMAAGDDFFVLAGARSFLRAGGGEKLRFGSLCHYVEEQRPKKQQYSFHEKQFCLQYNTERTGVTQAT
ncbi:MAG TPA: hypothetical protein VGN63_06525 [Flavisolibacter sp.]|jgi:hypothetical protein|nr:hypothetical protein [Flavisolibacter sp.]